jgi:hypothetical protein
MMSINIALIYIYICVCGRICVCMVAIAFVSTSEPLRISSRFTLYNKCFTLRRIF